MTVTPAALLETLRAVATDGRHHPGSVRNTAGPNSFQCQFSTNGQRTFGFGRRSPVTRSRRASGTKCHRWHQPRTPAWKPSFLGRSEVLGAGAGGGFRNPPLALGPLVPPRAVASASAAWSLGDSSGRECSTDHGAQSVCLRLWTGPSPSPLVLPGERLPGTSGCHRRFHTPGPALPITPHTTSQTRLVPRLFPE